jgi:DNA-binding winged helix-turn-helix (wHTH) protein
MALFAFERFTLDTDDRRLRADGEPVDLNARYFDALALMSREQGRLISKERFLSEVWDGVPVTDEALTQCIKTLRRLLGDEAGRPKFIETVPKHGYRFIAPVKQLESGGISAPAADRQRWQQFLILGSAGTVGGAGAGLIGGLIYGFAAASAAGGGAISEMLVLVCLTLLVAIIGAAGVSFALATSAFARAPSALWTVIAGAAGGLVVGAFGKLLGIDAFDLLLGRAPMGITGAIEGLLVGTAAGVGLWLSRNSNSVGRPALLAGLTGAVGGALISMLGGRLMLGSLAIVAHVFPGSRLHVDQFGQLLGESSFGPITQFVSAILECALFCLCVVTAMALATRRPDRRA